MALILLLTSPPAESYLSWPLLTPTDPWTAGGTDTERVDGVQEEGKKERGRDGIGNGRKAAWETERKGRKMDKGEREERDKKEGSRTDVEQEHTEWMESREEGRGEGKLKKAA